MCVWVFARLPQRLKSTFFEMFSSLHSKKFQKTLILAFEANSALSRKNETKIVKITHSAVGCMYQKEKAIRVYYDFVKTF